MLLLEISIILKHKLRGFQPCTAVITSHNYIFLKKHNSSKACNRVTAKGEGNYVEVNCILNIRDDFSVLYINLIIHVVSTFLL